MNGLLFGFGFSLLKMSSDNASSRCTHSLNKLPIEETLGKGGGRDLASTLRQSILIYIRMECWIMRIERRQSG